MPYVALNSDTDERLYIWNYDYPKVDLAGILIVCHVCGAPMIIKHGLRVTPHFAHVADSNSKCPYMSRGESALHYYAKKGLIARLSGNGERYKKLYDGAEFDAEVWLPEINRFADVLITFPDGVKEAHEIQISPQTTDEFNARTADYTSLGIDVTWWCGPKLDYPEMRSWFMDNYGYFAFVRPQEQQMA